MTAKIIPLKIAAEDHPRVSLEKSADILEFLSAADRKMSARAGHQIEITVGPDGIVTGCIIWNQDVHQS